MAGQSHLRSAALQIPALPGKGSESRTEQPAALGGGCGTSPGGWSSPGGRHAGESSTSALSIALLVLTLPRARCNAPLSVAPRRQIHVYVYICILLFFALPGFSSSFDFADGRGEGLERVDSALPGTARTELKRESREGAGKATGSRGPSAERGRELRVALGAGQGPQAARALPHPLSQTDPPAPSRPQLSPQVPCTLSILIAANDKKGKNSGKQRGWKLLPWCE